MDKKPKISIVVPVYNEESLVEELVSRLKSVCDGLNRSYEIVIVDDGSDDGSFEKLKRIKETDEALRLIRLTRNFGQQSAVLAGFRMSQGDIVVQLDSDLQNPPEEIPKLLTALTDDIDLVTTVHKKRQDGLLRVIGSKFLRGFGQMLFGESVKLNLSSFRAMRRSVIDKIETCRDRSRYMAVLMSWMGLPSVEIEVEHHARKKGETKYSFLTLFKLSWDLVTGYSSFPLRLVTYMGLFGAFMGFLMMAFLLYQRIANGILIEGFVVLSAVFAFFAGVQLLSIGFLGEYLGRVHSQIQGRPDYIVEKVMD
ncbi:MAG: glycosyltransferase [Nitrospina sp.]|jgi:undecaprenyl-phosphate 4-deoxy-4-formamido-L-arabinose transferase|nr:glycosyltransferase [Nitrospina sp.]MBT3413631.1 glycosyltransferase [Nitrospina sp.]MBT3858047.1 glycosyltransferase [Nitrospina sp.]MBT4104612.1 glycosyltransferase [Nitrospina sp.]MBT4390046.1 glycosyltransferase [Nitrospina sp.]